MTNPQKEIIRLITEQLTEHPELRFGQVLFNLGINEFADKENPQNQNFQLRDIHSDSDIEILKRMNKNL